MRPARLDRPGPRRRRAGRPSRAAVRDHQLADPLGQQRPRLRGQLAVGDQGVDVLQVGEGSSGRRCPTWCDRRSPSPGARSGTKARFVSDSARLGVVSPAAGSMPWQPRKSRSKWSDRITRSAIGPTRASDGVRMPPVRITANRAEPLPAGLSPSIRLAARTELVTTVSRGISRRCLASSKVVVPAESAIAVPGVTRAAAALAMASFSGRSQHGLGVEAGLVAARHARQYGAAVHLLDQPGPGQHLQVAADGHVRDAEALGQVADACAARAPDVLQGSATAGAWRASSAFPRREQAGRLRRPAPVGTPVSHVRIW